MEWVTMERLRIYIGEYERIEGRPAYEYIVKAAHDAGLAGANVLRGMMGYSGHSEIFTAKILRLSENLPVLVEIIDCRGNIDRFCKDTLTKLHQAFLIRDTVETVTMRPGEPLSGSCPMDE